MSLFFKIQIRTAQLNVLIFESRHKTAQFSAAPAQLASAEMMRQKFITRVEKFESWSAKNRRVKSQVSKEKYLPHLPMPQTFSQ